MNLEELLHEQAEGADLRPSSLDQITKRAGRIRRRRAAAGIAGVAAAVVVIAGGVAVVDHGHTSSLPPANAPTVTIDVSRTDAAHVHKGGPGIPYWADGQLIAPDGSTQASQGVPGSFVFNPPATSTPWLLGAQGNLAVTPDGKEMATARKLGSDDAWNLTLDTAAQGKTNLRYQSTSEDAPTGMNVVGFDDQNRVILNVQHGATSTMEFTQDGTSYSGSFTTVPGYDAAAATSAATGLVVAHPADGDDCYRLLIGLAAKPRGEPLCGTTGQFMFSADGAYLAALVPAPTPADAPAGFQWKGPGGVEIFDGHTGEPLVTYRMPYSDDGPTSGLVSTQFGWDGDSVVIPIFNVTPGIPEKHDWALAWLGTDGTWQIGHDSHRTGDYDEPPYAFGAGPVDTGVPTTSPSRSADDVPTTYLNDPGHDVAHTINGEPRVPYYDATTGQITDVDGSVVALQDWTGSVESIAKAKDGSWYVLGETQGTDAHQVLMHVDASGTRLPTQGELDLPTIRGGLTSTPDGSAVAYTWANSVTEVSTTGAQTWTVSSGSVVGLAGILPDGSVALTTYDEGAHAYQVQVAGPDGRVRPLDITGGPTFDHLTASSTSPAANEIAVVFDSGDDACWGIVDASSGAMTQHVCDESTAPVFSPDGSKIAAYDNLPGTTGQPGFDVVTIYDASTLQGIRRYTTASAGAKGKASAFFGWRLTWDGESVLVPTWESSVKGWTMLWLSPSGTPNYQFARSWIVSDADPTAVPPFALRADGVQYVN